MDIAKSIREKHLSLLSLELNNLRRKIILTDVVLVHCELKYPANKNILAASSKYFLNIFTLSGEENRDRIEISEKITPHALLEILNFCYTGNIEVFDIDEKYLKELLFASTELKIDLVTQYCIRLLSGSLTADNFYFHWELAIEHDNEEMKIDVCNLMAKEFATVHDAPDFLKIDVDGLKMILKSEELAEVEKDMVFNAMLNWVQENKEERLENLKELLPLVKLGEVSLDCLEDVEDDYELLVDNSKELRKMINKEIKLRYRELRKTNAQPTVQVNRTPEVQTKSSDTKFVSSLNEKPISAMNTQIEKKIETTLVTVAETATPEAKPMSNGYHHSSDRPKRNSCTDCVSREVTNNNVGSSGDILQYPTSQDGPTVMMVKVSDKNSSIQLFNTSGEKISVAMPVDETINLHYHSAVCHDADYVYFVGGRDGACEVQSSFYTFGLKSKKWEKREDINIPRWAAGVTSMNGFVYVVGGVGNLNHRLNSAERYDPKKERWEELPPMNLCRERPAVTEFKDRVYVIGGYTVLPDQAVKREMAVETTATCEVYDQSTRLWTKLPTKIPLGREIKEKSLVITVMGSKIYAIQVASTNDSIILHDYNAQINYWKSNPICDRKFGPWLSFDYVGDKEFYLVDVNGNIFQYVEGKKLQQVSFENCIGPRVTYSIIY